MKKLIFCIPVILVILFLTLPSLFKSINFKNDRNYLDVLPVEYSLDEAKDYVLITDEIEIFKKLLVETPIDLDISEDSPSLIALKSEDEEGRIIIFYLTGSDDNKSIGYDEYDRIFGVTYDKFNGDKSFMKPFAHHNALSLKKSLMIGDQLLKVNTNDKKIFIQVGAEDKCSTARAYIQDISLEVAFCGLSDKERDYILYTMKSN